MQKLYEQVKSFILNNEGCNLFSSEDFEKEEFDNLSDNDKRYHYMLSFSRSNPYLYVMFTTIRPIRILIMYDEDINTETKEITNQQISILVQTAWEEDESFEMIKRYHYFVNSIEDFDLQKIENHYNDLLDQLPNNNFSLIRDELELFVNEVKNNLKEEY